MLYQWYETGMLMYVLVAICGVGVFSRLMLGRCMNGWLRSTEQVETSEKKWVRALRQEYIVCCQNYGKVNNVDIFVDKHLGNCRYFGLRLSTWGKIGGQVIMLAVGIIVFSIAIGILYRQDAMRIMFEFFVGSWLVLINLVVDNLINREEKEAQIRINLMEFFENHPFRDARESEVAAEIAEESEKTELPKEATEENLEKKVTKAEQRLFVEKAVKAEQETSAEKGSEAEQELSAEKVVKAEQETSAEKGSETERETQEQGRTKKQSEAAEEVAEGDILAALTTVEAEASASERKKRRNNRFKASMHRKEELKQQLIEERKQKREEIVREIREHKEEKEREEQIEQEGNELIAAVLKEFLV